MELRPQGTISGEGIGWLAITLVLGALGGGACGRTPLDVDLHGGDFSSGTGDGDGDGDGVPAVPSFVPPPTQPPPTVPPPPPPPVAPPEAPTRCGDGIRNGAEACDGTDLGDLTCQELGFGGGTLACQPYDCALDDRRCVSSSTPTDAFLACMAVQAEAAPSQACAEGICTCNLPDALACGAECWEAAFCFQRCVNDSGLFNRDCGNECIIGNVGDPNQAVRLLPCMLREECGFMPPPPPAFCGNGVRDGEEICDGFDTGGITCATFGRSGVIQCDAACRIRLDGCGPPVDRCGNGALDVGETCDPTVVATFPCENLGLSGGQAVCTPECQVNVGDCGSVAPCGNGTIDPGEACDTMNLGGRTCDDFGLAGGDLGCTPDCALDLSACGAAPECGDGVSQGLEPCDGDDVAGLECTDFGFTGGNLRCSDRCDFDTSECRNCGDGRVGQGEQCDGANLAGQSCRSLGFSGGALDCDAGCNFDTSSCAVCGNGVVEIGEVCDRDDLAMQTCESLGAGMGTLTCAPGSCRFDISGCGDPGLVNVCGNGIAEPGEACDGADLANNSCRSLGFSDGTLGCNPTTCRFVTSGCSEPPGQEDCGACTQRACAESVSECEADPGCLPGLSCIAERCGPQTTGPGGQLSCTLGCFGRPDTGLRALSMFSCIAAECGPECVGAR